MDSMLLSLSLSLSVWLTTSASNCFRNLELFLYSIGSWMREREDDFRQKQIASARLSMTIEKRKKS